MKTAFDLQPGDKCKVFAASRLFDGVVTDGAHGNPPCIQVRTDAGKVVSQVWETLLFSCHSLDAICCAAKLVLLDPDKPEPTLADFMPIYEPDAAESAWLEARERQFEFADCSEPIPEGRLPYKDD